MKYRIIKCGAKFKIQQKRWFFWNTWTDTPISPLGEMYSPMDVTYDFLEEAENELAKEFEDEEFQVIKTYSK